VIQRAKDLIESRQQEDLSVGDVAKMLNISVFYFCKVFRKATGLTFTEYLAQVRVAKARNLLQNPHVRISEVAFEVGFQSITHFNRVFRKLTGESPTAFRSRIWATNPPKRATEAMAWI
jgi:AraC-like DNA-binding protein